MKTKSKSVNFDDLFQEELSDPTFIPGYLQEMYLQGGISLFLEGLRKVIAATNGFTQAARKTEVTREALYRSLSATGKPSIITIDKLLETVGIKFSFISQSELKKKSRVKKKLVRSEILGTKKKSSEVRRRAKS